MLCWFRRTARGSMPQRRNQGTGRSWPSSRRAGGGAEDGRPEDELEEARWRRGRAGEGEEESAGQLARQRRGGGRVRPEEEAHEPEVRGSGRHRWGRGGEQGEPGWEAEHARERWPGVGLVVVRVEEQARGEGKQGQDGGRRDREVVGARCGRRPRGEESCGRRKRKRERKVNKRKRPGT